MLKYMLKLGIELHCVGSSKLASILPMSRVRTVLENPGKPWNLKIKIQALENP